MTDQAHYRRLESLFHELVDLPPDASAQRLEQLRQEDPDLAAAVAAMLTDSLAAGERAFDEIAQHAKVLALAPGMPAQIGPYRVLSVLGEGGMGRVYQAEQTTPVQRRVAVKLTHAGLDNARFIARFHAERQALAVLDHPNIARIFDAGSHTDGRPWFAMELVEGMAITLWANARNLGLRERLELLLPVCDAISHAHRKGVIHRDLKPSNILVSEIDGNAVPKIIDFGIAKALHGDLQEATHAGELIGTPEYMSPEQASLGAIDIDTRSDVYALGLVLFELLVGQLPLTLADLRRLAFDEMCRRVREDEPPRPSAVLSASRRSVGSMSSAEWARRVQGDLDAVVLKALAKDREQRYDSVGGLADDLRRYLNDQPVRATPPNWRYRLRKFVKRHRALAIAAGIASVAVGMGAAFGINGYVQAQRSAAEAKVAQAEAESTAEFMLDLFKAADPRREPGIDPTARDLLARGVSKLQDPKSSDMLAAGVRLRVLEEIAAASIALGDYRIAEKQLQVALAARQQEQPNQPKRLAFVLDRLSFIALQQSDWPLAIERSRASLKVLAQSGQHHATRYTSDAALRALNNLAVALKNNQNFTDAEQTLQSLIDLSTERGPVSNGYLAGAQLQMAMVKIELDEFDQALESIQKAAHIFQQIHPPNHPAFSALYNNASFAQRKAGNLAEALMLAEKSRANQDVNLPKAHAARAEVLHNEAMARIGLGQLRRADAQLSEAIALLDASLGPQNFKRWMRVDARAGIAILQMRFNDAVRELEALLGAIAIDASTLRLRLSAIQKLALAQRGLGDFRSALATAERVKSLAETENQPLDQAASELLLALLQLDLNEPEVAARHYARALELDPRCVDRPCVLDQGSSLLLRAQYLARSGATDAALTALQYAIDHRLWSTSILSHSDLKPLHAHPRWSQLTQALTARIAAEGHPAPTD